MSADTAALVEHCAYNVREIPEPATYVPLMKHFKAHMQKNGSWLLIQSTASLVENDTLDLVEFPKGRTAVGCKWVFKVKYDGEGKAVQCKRRLVAKGYSQKYGIYFKETFSPVVGFSFVQTLLALAVQKNMIVHQMDVVTAFLNGKLDEEIYMQQPDGYQVSGKGNLVAD